MLRMFKGPVLGLAVLITSPALWSGFVTGSLDLTDTLARFLAGVVIAVLMLSFLRSVTNGYQRAARLRAVERARAETEAAKAKTAPSAGSPRR
jgi:uncharacterized membrane protein YcjF (UPF0283 family)